MRRISIGFMGKSAVPTSQLQGLSRERIGIDLGPEFKVAATINADVALFAVANCQHRV